MRLLTAKIPTKNITKGMILVEYGVSNKPRRIEVTEVQHSACSSRNTHVNKSMCYDRAGMVEILVGTEKDRPSEMNTREILEHLGIDPDLVKT